MGRLRSKHLRLYALKWCPANDHPNSKRPNDLKTDVRAGQFLMVLEKK